MPIPILAAAAVFVTVFIFFIALGGRDSEMRTRLDSLWRQPDEQEPEARLSLTQRLFAPAMGTLVSYVRRLLPTTMLERIQHRLVVAGEPMTLNGFLTLQVLTTGAFLLLPPLLVLAAGLSLSLFVLIFIAFFAGVGLVIPYVWLQQRVGQRRNHIIKNLPDSFDLITTCVEAGLGLDAALARVAEKVEGPFADELRRMLREISLGKMRRDALRELGERTGVPDLVSFVNAVIQAEEMGSSVGLVLRVQAEQLRIRRRQRAEQQAFQAPIKMIFPLVLCIFPTLFIVILGPAVITIMNEFSK